MRYRVSVKGWENALTTAHLSREEAEARIDESIRINSGSRDDYVITEVDEPSRPCVHCGGEIVNDTRPDCDFCRMCWATGTHDTVVHADKCERLSGMLGQREVTVWQTGGGCMAFGATLAPEVPDGEQGELLISSESSVDEDPDEPVWGYSVTRFGEGEEWHSDGYGEGDLTLWEAADRAGKVADMAFAEYKGLVAAQV